jgi:hypothetical protein
MKIIEHINYICLDQIPEFMIKHEGEAIWTWGPISIATPNSLLDFFIKKGAVSSSFSLSSTRSCCPPPSSEKIFIEIYSNVHHPFLVLY